MLSKRQMFGKCSMQLGPDEDITAQHEMQGCGDTSMAKVPHAFRMMQC